MEQKEKKMRHILLTLHGTWIGKYFSFFLFFFNISLRLVNAWKKFYLQN